MEADKTIETLFSDYFADDVEPVLRYASLRKSDSEGDIGKEMTPTYNSVMAREMNNDNKD